MLMRRGASRRKLYSIVRPISACASAERRSSDSNALPHYCGSLALEILKDFPTAAHHGYIDGITFEDQKAAIRFGEEVLRCAPINTPAQHIPLIHAAEISAAVTTLPASERSAALHRGMSALADMPSTPILTPANTFTGVVWRQQAHGTRTLTLAIDQGNLQATLNGDRERCKEVISREAGIAFEPDTDTKAVAPGIPLVTVPETLIRSASNGLPFNPADCLVAYVNTALNMAKQHAEIGVGKGHIQAVAVQPPLALPVKSL